MKGYDTHIHTLASDGCYGVAQIIKMAQEQSLQGIAVTDHDTVGALPEALKLSRQYSFPVIPGLELSTEYGEISVHILGYFIDIENEKLLKKLEELRQSRAERINKILALLRQNDMPIEKEDLEIGENQAAGRPHIARAMVKKRYVKCEKEAFEKWLNKGMPCYVERMKLHPLEGMSIIKEAGGIACLAHPGLEVPDELIENLTENGLEAIEVYHPEHTSAQEIKYYNIAKSKNLIYLGGSDFHGTDDKKVGLKFTPMEQIELLYMKAGRRI